MTKEEQEAWRRGYESGMQVVLRKEDAAIKIGTAILNVLDTRYQFVQEDY